MEVNNNNYFSKEVRGQFLSSSFIKDACGCAAKKGCEARAVARLKGEYTPERTTALMVGSYVDSYFEGTINEFEKNNPECFTIKFEQNEKTIIGLLKYDKYITKNNTFKSGMLTIARNEHPECFTKIKSLKSELIQANEIIEFAKKDKTFMQMISGKPQVICQGKIFDIPFIGKLDFDFDFFITDLKVMRDFKKIWSDELHRKQNFIFAWKIDEQQAIYQELIRQETGVKKEMFIAALTKEKTPDKAIIKISNENLLDAMQTLEFRAKRSWELMQGATPDRCEECEYCKATKKLNGYIDADVF